MPMKSRYRLFQRGSGIFFVQDNTTGKQESLRTRDRDEAQRLVNTRNEAFKQPAMNMQLAQIYLQHSDPQVARRTWQTVMVEMVNLKHGETRIRWQYAIKESAFDIIRNQPLIQTTAEQFLRVLEAGTVSTNVHLRKLHNFAVGMHWLPWPVLPKKQWPAVQFKEKRAISHEEHQKILAGEQNPEWRAYYQLLWHIGGSQTDVALLSAEDIDWKMNVIGFRRRKTGSVVNLHFGSELANILSDLPGEGPLFPMISRGKWKDRAKAFGRRCRLVGVSGVSLHSYRYAWAERAKEAGYPERFAQVNLGHNSKAAHRAYAAKAHVKLPSLEEWTKATQSAAA